MQTIAKKIEILRREYKQSLQEVADAIGFSKAHVYEVETGKQDNPSIKFLIKIAEHFGVTVSHLINESDVIFEHSDIQIATRDYFAAAALQGLLASNNHERLGWNAYAIADDILKEREPKQTPSTEA